MLPDNHGYNDPADLPEVYNPTEADDYILYLIETGQVPELEGV